jgi:glycosyltransferase involved in cell wall biosynthesis
MVHVCIISPRLYKYLDQQNAEAAGGAQRQQHLVSKRLIDRGQQVSAIIGDYGQPRIIESEGITGIKGIPERIESSIQLPKHVFNLYQAMRDSGADVFFVRGGPRMAVATYILSNVLGKRFVFCLADDKELDLDYIRANYPPLVATLYKTAITKADSVMAQTRRQRDTLKERFDIDALHVPNGYDIPPEDELLPHTNRDAVLWVGSSDPEQKNPELYLELAEQLPDLDFQMISLPIPGEENYHEELKELARSIPNLEFIGPVQPQNVHEYYRRAKILVNTSDYEGFPNTFLEAWRYETPVVSLFFDLDGVLKQGDVGEYAGSMDNLVQYICRLGSDSDLRAEFGQAGRKYTRENYSLEEVVDRYESVFESVVD